MTGATGAPLPNVVYTTGTQEIIGSKTFYANQYIFSGANILVTGNSNVDFSSRPTVSGTGVLLQNEGSLFDGNRNITRLPTLNSNVGGSNVVEFLNNLFFPFVQATISLNSFNTIYELGTTLANVNFTGGVTTGTVNPNNITNISGYVGGSSRVGVQPNLTITNNTATFNFSVNVNLTNTASNNVTVSGTSINENAQPIIIGNSLSPRTINFQAPFYYGSGIANLTPSEITGQMVKLVQLKSEKILTYGAMNTPLKLYFAYPRDSSRNNWGDISAIFDGNGFPNTTDWNPRDETFKLRDNTDHVYRIMEKIIPVQLTGPFNYTFRF